MLLRVLYTKFSITVIELKLGPVSVLGEPTLIGPLILFTKKKKKN